MAGHRETHSLKSDGLRDWLTRRYYERYRSPAHPQAVQAVLDTLAARARFEGQEHPVFLRIAEHGDAIYVDLGSDTWNVVEVTAAGWRVADSCPVRFRRSRGMSPLPMPEREGSIDELRPFVNVDTDDDFVLLVAWLLGALRPRGPYPILEINGGQGSAKTTAARIVRALVDPSTSPVRAEPRDTRDLMIAATNCHCVAFDNLSYVPTWLSDALCRLSTGGGFATRALYTDAGEQTFEVQRPVILTGIEDLATRGDLLDRVLALTLPAVSARARRPEADVWRDFDTVKVRLLGVLLDAVSASMRNLNTVDLPELPRMADFAQWVTAGESAFGWEPGTFLAAYELNRAQAHVVAIEASSLGLYIRDLARDRGEWSGTATELLDTLEHGLEFAGFGRRVSLPRSPNRLSADLRRLAPNLMAVGVEITFARVGRDGVRTITIRSAGNIVSSVSTVGTTGESWSADSRDERQGQPGEGSSLPSPPSGALDGGTLVTASAITTPVAARSGEETDDRSGPR